MIYQLKIQLQGITKPPVWRRILIPSEASFANLHEVIQKAFGWEDYHNFQFQERPYEDGWLVVEDFEESTEELSWLFSTNKRAAEVPIKEYLNTSEPKIVYIYDFGDDWIHTIKLENADVKDSPDPEHAHCIAGKGCCPPEDCGGAGIYSLMKEFIMEHPQWAIRAARGKETPKDEEREFADEYEEEAYLQVREAGMFFKVIDRKPDFSKIDLDKIEAEVSKVHLDHITEACKPELTEEVFIQRLQEIKRHPLMKKVFEKMLKDKLGYDFPLDKL